MNKRIKSLVKFSFGIFNRTFKSIILGYSFVQKDGAHRKEMNLKGFGCIFKDLNSSGLTILGIFLIHL